MLNTSLTHPYAFQVLIMNKEELLLQKRLVELSRIVYTREIVTFSEFLNLNELNILHTTPKNMLLSQYKTYGGYGLSERQMAAFLPMPFIMIISTLFRL